MSRLARGAQHRSGGRSRSGGNATKDRSACCFRTLAPPRHVRVARKRPESWALNTRCSNRVVRFPLPCRARRVPRRARPSVSWSGNMAGVQPASGRGSDDAAKRYIETTGDHFAGGRSGSFAAGVASSLSSTGLEGWSLLISLAPVLGSIGVTLIADPMGAAVHLK